MLGGRLVDVAVSKSPAILQLLAQKHDALLVKRTRATAFKNNISTTAQCALPQWTQKSTQMTVLESQDAILVVGCGGVQHHNH